MDVPEVIEKGAQPFHDLIYYPTSNIISHWNDTAKRMPEMFLPHQRNLASYFPRAVCQHLMHEASGVSRV